MTITKLRIDLSNGQLEIEGDKDLVRAVYNDFKDQMVTTTSVTNSPSRSTAERLAGRKRGAKLNGTGPKKRGRKSPPRTGRQRRSRAEAAAMRKDMKAALKDGVSASELADLYGVSRSYVYQQK